MPRHASHCEIEYQLAESLRGTVNAADLYGQGTRGKAGYSLSPAVMTSQAATALTDACHSAVTATGMLLGIPEARNYIAAASGIEVSKAWSGSKQIIALPFARPDAVIGESSVSINEVNVTSRLGMLFEHDAAVQRFESEPSTQHRLRESGLVRGAVRPELAKVFRSVLPTASRVCIAVGDRLGKQGAAYLPKLIEEDLITLGYEAKTVPVHEITLSDHGAVNHPEHGRFDGTYRLFGREDLAGSDASRRELLEAIDSGRITIFDDFAGETFVNKVIMELLSTQSWLSQLPRPLAEAVRACVPWTRVMRRVIDDESGRDVDAAEFAIQNQSQLVIKPACGSGGVWVVIGPDVSPDSWARSIRNALRSRTQWVIQKFAASEPANLPHWDIHGRLSSRPRALNFGALIVGGTCAGIIRRDGDLGAGNLNATQGSRVVPAYWPSSR